MSKPSPYCECHKWDQPGGICAYCTGYTDGWTTETAALRRERDALAARVEALRTGIRKAMSTCARRDHGHVECWKDGRDALDDEGNAAGNNGQDDAFMHERTAHIALAHLAARVVEAEQRAERAEARAFWQMVCIAKARECIWRKMNARDAEGRGALHDEHDRLLAFAGVERGDWCAP